MSATSDLSVAMRISPLGDAIGAQVSGVDISNLSQLEFARIRAAWSEYLVLLFRDQDLSVADHVAFSERFGTLERAPMNIQGRPWIGEHPEIAVMSNVVENGQRMGSLGAGEAIWHTDMSYRERPPSASLLYAREVPPDGSGRTGFANMYEAYEGLPMELREVVDGLTIVHDESRKVDGLVRATFLQWRTRDPWLALACAARLTLPSVSNASSASSRLTSIFARAG